MNLTLLVAAIFSTLLTRWVSRPRLEICELCIFCGGRVVVQEGTPVRRFEEHLGDCRA